MFILALNMSIRPTRFDMCNVDLKYYTGTNLRLRMPNPCHQIWVYSFMVNWTRSTSLISLIFIKLYRFKDNGGETEQRRVASLDEVSGIEIILKYVAAFTFHEYNLVILKKDINFTEHYFKYFRTLYCFSVLTWFRLAFFILVVCRKIWRCGKLYRIGEQKPGGRQDDISCKRAVSKGEFLNLLKTFISGILRLKSSLLKFNLRVHVLYVFNVVTWLFMHVHVLCEVWKRKVVYCD